MPPSTRSKGGRRRRALFIEQVVQRMAPFILSPDKQYMIHCVFYGDWFTKRGKIKRRDLPNLLGYLSDDVAYALGIDDKGWFAVGMEKRRVPKGQNEYVGIQIYEGSIDEH